MMTTVKRLMFGFFIVCAVLAVHSLAVEAQNRVVVIPLMDSPTGPPAPVAKTGAPTSDTPVPGEDGVLEKGVAWPSPRFTDNGDGTVTDNLTDLIWLKNAGCFMPGDWATAISNANTLASATDNCGLTDGSVAGDWRLPNRFELESLLDLGEYEPALPSGHPFTNVEPAVYYWTSSTVADTIDTSAWEVYLDDGSVEYYEKTDDTDYTWPVRGGN